MMIWTGWVLATLFFASLVSGINKIQSHEQWGWRTIKYHAAPTLAHVTVIAWILCAMRGM